MCSWQKNVIIIFCIYTDRICACMFSTIWNTGHKTTQLIQHETWYTNKFHSKLLTGPQMFIYVKSFTTGVPPLAIGQIYGYKVQIKPPQCMVTRIHKIYFPPFITTVPIYISLTLIHKCSRHRRVHYLTQFDPYIRPFSLPVNCNSGYVKLSVNVWLWL